ncbi:MAG: hypothetical protein M3367_05460 [Acidobacteriota bacterium]|nr:hypothetical protein [Acidobacteriota bacterium]
MKYKYPVLIMLSVIFFLGWANFSYLQEKENQTQKLEITVKSSKGIYLTGEVVDLTFGLRNKSNEEVTISNHFNTEDGYLHVFISQDGKNFKKYYHPKWGRIDAARGPIQLKSEDNLETSARIFWNKKPDVAGLSPMAAEQTTEGKILTDYAFPKTGTYFIKAIYSNRFTADPLRRVKIESEPIQVTIEEPIGDDLIVWNKIKDRSDLAYFIQEGGFPEFKFDSREKLKQEVEQIINQYPNSIIVGQMKQSLEKFQINEERRGEYRRKLQQAKEQKP